MQAFYAVANAFPRWETLVPASAAIGLMFGATSIVYGVYVTTLAELATSTSRNRNDDPDSTSTDEIAEGQSLRPMRKHTVVCAIGLLYAAVV